MRLWKVLLCILQLGSFLPLLSLGLSRPLVEVSDSIDGRVTSLPLRVSGRHRPHGSREPAGYPIGRKWQFLSGSSNILVRKRLDLSASSPSNGDSKANRGSSSLGSTSRDRTKVVEKRTYDKEKFDDSKC